MKPKCGTSITPNRLGFGGVGLGSASGAGWRADVRLVEEAADRGVAVFDTADAYGAGASEKVLGQALRRRRADVVIATKAGYRFRERSRIEQTARRGAGRLAGRVRTVGDGTDAATSGGGSAYQDKDFSPRYLHDAVEASLRRLRSDYLDVFQLHGPADVRPEVLDELRDLVVAGKVRRLGVGAESVASAAEWASVAGVDVIQTPFGVLDPEAARTVLPLVSDSAIEVWARGVLGGGLLKAAAEAPATVRTDPKWAIIDSLHALSRRSGIAPDELAIGFVRAQPDVSVVLLGMKSRAHLRRNLDLMAAPPLDPDLVAEIWNVVAGTPGDSRG